MNPSTATATVLVDEPARCGVTEVVLCPGSRSAPLAYAVQAADRDGRLRLHVRVDERSAGFLALGLAKVSRRPAVVVTTSGTAAANLHPAVLEAHHGQVPMIVLTADRPAEIRGVGANQTTVQPGLYGDAVRWQVDVPAAHGRVGEQRAWRTAVDRGWAAATGCSGPWGVREAGPVHLNVGFRDPLPPDLLAGADGWPEPLEGRPDGRPWTASATSTSRVGSFTGSAVPEAVRRIPVTGADDPVEDRTLMVLGDLPDPTMAAPALRFAELRGWPVVAEPFGAGDRGPALPHGPLMLAAGDWLEEHLPTRVLVVGRLTLSREVAGLLRDPRVRVEAVSAAADWADPGHLLAEVHPWTELLAAVAEAEDEVATWGAPSAGDDTWARAWQAVGAAVAGAVRPVIEQSWPSGVAVARTVLDTLGLHDTLVVGSSNPARDVNLALGADLTATVLANRGLAGIDGAVSTAMGVALSASAGHRHHRPSEGRVVAVMGDLTFLHDSNGLLIGPEEPKADLTIVVVNDDGGGIFHTLEYGEPARAADFERIFGTPTGTDLAAVCRAHHVGHTVASSPDALTKALTRAPDEEASGIRVVEVAVPRGSHRELRDRLRRVAAEAAAGLQQQLTRPVVRR